MSRLLSICIPTYNRAEILRQTLESITTQPCFNKDELEVVVSDNCSSDHTEDIVHEYTSRFPEKVKYFRNQTNLVDLNFIEALRHGAGEFLKLSNDTAVWKSGSLSCLLNIVKRAQPNHTNLFFTNGRGHTAAGRQDCQNFDETVDHLSFLATWVGAFGIWRQDLLCIENPGRAAFVKLIQTDLFIRLATQRTTTVVTEKLFEIVVQKNKGTYNIFEIFVHNYLSLLQVPLANGHLSRKTYEKEKVRLLTRHVLPLLGQSLVDKSYRYDLTGWSRYSRSYASNWYRFLLFPVARLYGTGVLLKRALGVLFQ